MLQVICIQLFHIKHYDAIFFSSFPEIENGFIVDQTRQYYFGDEARVQCYKGFKQIGSNIIKCNDEQQFDSLPACEGKTDLN